LYGALTGTAVVIPSAPCCDQLSLRESIASTKNSSRSGISRTAPASVAARLRDWMVSVTNGARSKVSAIGWTEEAW